MVSITRPERFRFARLSRIHIALTTIALLLVLDLGRSINARVGYAAPVSEWQPSPSDYADLTWPPGADLSPNIPLGARVFARRCAVCHGPGDDPNQRSVYLAFFDLNTNQLMPGANPIAVIPGGAVAPGSTNHLDFSSLPAAMATGTINCFASGLGGFLGPAFVGYQAARTHSFRFGFAVLVVALVIAGVLPLTLRIRGHVVAPSAGT